MSSPNNHRPPLATPSRPESGLTLFELVVPELTNHYGTLFAVQGLALLGKAAYLAAARFTGRNVVMAGSRQIRFAHPVPLGGLLRIDAHIVRVGKSSLSVRVEAGIDAASQVAAERAGQVALDGDFDLVAVDAAGRPVPIAAPATSQSLSPPG